MGGQLTAPQRFRAGFIVVCAVFGGLWALVAAVSFDGAIPRWTAAAGGIGLIAALPLVARGRVSAAGALAVSSAVVALAALAWQLGADSGRLSGVLVAPLLAGAALGARAAFASGVLLAAMLAALGLAASHGWAPLVADDGTAWHFLVRQLVVLTGLTVALRIGFDRAHASLLAHDDALARANAELADENARLEDRVDERTALLTRRARARENLARAVADRLRAPLDQIDAELAALSPAVRGAREIETASRAAVRLADMVDCLLEHARLGTEFRRTEVDLEAMVDDIVATHAAAGVDWRRTPLPVVRGDATLLRNALDNLIGNAVKFSRTRPSPVVEIDWLAAERTLRVRDNGVGFDPRHAGKLFKPFQRLHGVKDFEGVGVGLANVRRIAEAHGGRCWAESETDAGAAFYLSLPEPGGDTA